MNIVISFNPEQFAELVRLVSLCAGAAFGFMMVVLTIIWHRRRQ